MEELLKNVSASKTFSITPRQAKKFNGSECFEFDDAQRHGIDEIPQPTTVPSGRKATTGESDNNEESTSARFAYPSVFKQGKENCRQTYAAFIANDRNIYLQRKFLLQQEKLQKHTAVSWAAASSSKKLNTKGLQLEDEQEELVKAEDVTNWPQYEYDSVRRLEKYHEKRGNQEGRKKNDGKSKANRFWSALFPEQNTNDTRDAYNNNQKRKRRIFPDPAYILHLSILKVRDEREGEAIKILKGKLASLSVLRKTNLRPFVNELFLKALDKGFDDLIQILIEAGFPENFNHSIYGDGKSRRFLSYILLAIGLGRLKVVQKMLEVQPRVFLNRGWFNGIRPLMLAQMTRKVPGQSLLMTQLLLKHGAESNRSISYSTYMKGLSFINQTKIKIRNSSRSQTSKEAPKGVRTPRGRREIYKNSRLYALDFAIFREKFESAHLILSSKNSSDWLIKNEFCLLNLEDFEMAADILQRAPELIKQRDPRGNTPLHWASKLGRTDMVSLYLRYTSNVDVLNFQHWTPLHEAAAGAHRATVQYLISCGADCSIKNMQGKTALQVARENGITSEELYEFFHSADTMQRTQQLIGQLTIPEITPKPDEKGSRLLIQKLMKYPRKLWKRSFKFS